MNWPLRRRLLSRFANIYIRAVTRLSARDCTSGYRCWRREALAALPLDRFISDGYSFLVEMLFVARAARLPDRRSADHVRRAARGRVEDLEGGALESAITPWRLIATANRRKRRARSTDARFRAMV